MSGAARDARGHSEPQRETRSHREPEPRATETRRDPLAEIRERQRALEALRARHPASSPRTEDAPASRRMPPLPPTVQPSVQGEMLVREITEALSSLRRDLKSEIADGLAHELGHLRAEMQSLKAFAAGRHTDVGVQEDLARLADSVSALSHSGGPAAQGLREEFNQLKSLMDGLAREDSLRDMENRWTDLEMQINHFDPGAMREELGRMALRLEDVKHQLGAMSDSRSVRALEDKLIAVATALEDIGSRAPTEDVFRDQFAGLDLRLDEISRAIVAGKHKGPEQDPRLLERLDERLSGLALQMETLAHPVGRDDASEELARRIEMLANRMEELSGAREIQRLEERIDSLTQIVGNAQQMALPPELTDALVDLSSKIDAMGDHSVDSRLTERLDRLVRMIEDLEAREAPTVDHELLRRLDDRMADIAGRLDETMNAPAGDSLALRGLEDQIANLSRLLSEAPQTAGIAPDVNERIGVLEEYMATSDEYIIEAARQAAEAVMANFAHDAGRSGVQPSGADLETVAALAQSLRHLESISRDSEARNQRTLDSLKDTLLDIADRLDRVHVESQSAPQAFASAPIDLPSASQSGTAQGSKPAPASPPVSDETLVAERIGGEAVEPEAPAKKPSKPSLLAGIGARLRPAPKAPETVTPDRQMVDPAPSIDPADILPSEEANELLEPGSGAPDVRKILERVRAASLEGNPVSKSDGERTDYIAAARRAAQAAAQEASRMPAATARTTAASGESKSLFVRYRRPILMAAGAVLLIVMAMPLAKSLTHRAKAPAPAVPAITEGSKTSSDAGASAPKPEMKVETAAATAAPDVKADDTAAGFSKSGPQPENIVAVPVPAEDAPQSSAPETARASDDIDANIEAAVKRMPASDQITGDAPDVGASLDAITPAALADAARNGDANAMFEVGARYSDGRGVEANMATAAAWYQRAAEKGLAPAQYRLGNLYEKGSGVARDLDKARDLYEQAASKGNANAMHNLAVLYASGALGSQDYAKAAKWFEDAANAGVGDSQFNLAILYARGNGVTADLSASYKWFAIAARDGDKDAAQKRDEIAPKLKPEVRDSIDATVETWKPAVAADPTANEVPVPDEWVGKAVKTSSVDMKKVIQNVQGILNNNGFDTGVPDGVMGKKTVAAIKAFQTSVGQTPTGQIDDALVKELLARNK